MKSPLGKLKKLGLNKSVVEENWDHHISVHIDGLTQAAKDMKDMRTCYDGLLSAAAATANSAYEFSESLLEMGNCLLEKTAVHADGESGGTLSLLGRVQLDLQTLVDSYEMKLQCDEKKEMFEYMVGQIKEKGKSRHGKGETVTSEQLQAVREEYDEAARLCVFRVASLKQGQCRSLLTQAARHHAAQLNFFRKGLLSLEAVEPHIRDAAEKQHIDYALSESNDGEEGADDNSFEANEDGELSFEYCQSRKDSDNTSGMRNSMELDPSAGPSQQIPQIKNADSQIYASRNQHRAGSHSAPLYAEKFDPAEKIREMRASMQKFSSRQHVLPTPDDAKGSITISSNFTPAPVVGPSRNPWHSSPLDIEKQKKSADDYLPATENVNHKKHFLPLPRPLPENNPNPTQQPEMHHVSSEGQKVKRQAFSGPIVSKASSSGKPLVLLPASEAASMLNSRAPLSVNVSHKASPPLVSSPKISELHELPRPPDALRRAGSPLPRPQLTVSRSFSIPSSSERARAFHSGKLLEPSQGLRRVEEAGPSPPLTPMSLSNMK
ncbi:hydroxyproline-rich glycoprotein family protein [Striga asiatica]|uniref:Hydroxyproline-rich glycoprotein family protein n=1 Tax=Striga asiatica TaxID=4170 RepID=A0A5A7QCH5_STRAF|nr:hydroxyproline-rich glycoprotein family protein [Striga asiatica]